MTIIIRKKAGSKAFEKPEIVPRKPQPKKKPKPKEKNFSYYKKAFPNVDVGLLFKTFKDTPENLEVARQSLQDTKQCHSSYFYFFIKAVGRVDHKQILSLPPKHRWEFICDQVKGKEI